MKKHVKNSPTLKTLLHAACLTAAMAVPSYVFAVQVGIDVGAGAKSGANKIDTRNGMGTGVVTDSRRTGVSGTTRNSVGTGVVMDSRRTGVNATGSGSVTGTGTGMGTSSITGTGAAPGTGTGTMGPTTGGITTGTTGTTGVGPGSNMESGADGEMRGPATTPSGLDGNLNQNSQMLPDGTRGLERAEERMNTQGADENDEATVKAKASVKAKKNTRNRSNSTTK